MKYHAFVHRSDYHQGKALAEAYADVYPTLVATGSSLFFCDAIGFDVLAPSREAAEKVRAAFGWKTLIEIEPGRYATEDNVW